MITILAAALLSQKPVLVIGSAKDPSLALIRRSLPEAKSGNLVPARLILVCPDVKKLGDFDDLVPRLRAQLLALKAKSAAPIAVCLPVLPEGVAPLPRTPDLEENDPEEREEQEEEEEKSDPWVAPSLMRQAAREAGVAVLDLETASRHGVDPTALRDAIDGLTPEDPAVKMAWKLVRYTSQQDDEGPAVNAIDGKPGTYWHSQYDPKTTRNPHELVIDLGAPQPIGGVWYLPRQDGGDNGVAKRVAVYVSDDANSWGDSVLAATLSRGIERSNLRFTKNATGRFLRFVILDAQNGGPYASAAEIGLLSPRR